MNKIDWKPVNLEECMKALGEVLTPKEQMQLVAFTKDELIQCHHGLGQWIRNNWDLWIGGELFDNMKAMGFSHPDDISMSLIREWWARMNKVPSILDDEIKRYAEYWEKQGQ